MNKAKWLGVTVLLLVVGAATIVLSPSSSTDSSTTAVGSTDDPNSATPGLRVYLDPETGELTNSDPNATIELDPELENTLRHDDEGLVIEEHAHGARSMNLQGRYGDVVVVRIGENGKQFFCSTEASAVEKGINDTTTPTGPEVK
jgi:hypothetical protein